MQNNDTVTIYVALLDEGTACWRPIEAVRDGEDIYKIVSSNESHEDESWEFQCGDRVRCVQKTLSDGTVLVAVSHAD